MIPIALKLAAFVPDIVRFFSKSDTAAAVADKVVGIAKTITGHDDADAALRAIETDPKLALQFKTTVLASQTELEKAHLADTQAAHREQQETIRTGDQAEDEYVRHTRPKMARQSWYGMAAYVAVAEIAKAAGFGTGASFEIAALIGSPALAYIGFRSMFDKGGLTGMFGRKK